METEKRSKPKQATGAKDGVARMRSAHRASNQASQALSDALATYASQASPEEAAVLADTLLRLRQLKAGGTKPSVEFHKKTCTVAEAGRLCGISRGSAYKAARNGELPVERIGRRILVLVEPLMRMLNGAGAKPSSPPAEVQDPTEGGQQ